MSEHNHDCECGCGCEHDHDHEEPLFVTLTLEDDTQLECEVVAIFPVDEQSYIAVTPKDEESEDLFFFRLEPAEDNEEEAILVDIEDDDELEAVTDAFDELLDEQEWDDLTEE